ncbi:putative endo-beta-1,4-glucanase D [Ceratocystis fimbriata CBS 114723]|uniref:lytic cellulose monooxygenase (C4-dehydrogenating) n=1 Tax=Ceratocystis fimbriata CBS 114723 TaxID=1035309 RepID=A0A2C5X264_9PEZI|nr:putative endo-beta-1,4-glucanase D [Ceratocystis fimbriata CBS 114723]
MHFSAATLMAVVASLPSTLAHYNFDCLIVNGEVSQPYEFVRQTTNANSPITDVTSPDMICNAGGLDAAIMAKTQTKTVAPGDELGFNVNSELGHPGPLSLWMSKAPEGSTAATYKGDGDWFKVYELTTSSITAEGLQWATFNGGGAKNFTFTLPTDIPAGDYLFRAEHIALHGAGSAGGAQFYIGCAQLTVTGSGAGSPAPVTKIPGVYTGNEPGILINLYYPAPTSYEAPGPVTWPGACIDHTVNLNGQTSDGNCNGDDGSGSSGSGSSGTPSSSAPYPTGTTPSNAPVGTGSSTKPTSSAAAPKSPVSSSNPVGDNATPTTPTADEYAKPSSTQSSSPSTNSKAPSTCSRRRRARRAAQAARV